MRAVTVQNVNLIPKPEEFKATYPNHFRLPIKSARFREDRVQNFIMDNAMHPFALDLLSHPPAVMFADVADKTLAEMYILTLNQDS